MKPYKLIDHTADIGLRIYGESLEGLFRNAGFALFDLITDIAMVRPMERRRFTLERDRVDELLVEWLSSLIYIFDTEQLLFCGFPFISIDGCKLTAEAEGELFNPDRHAIRTTFKAVTYHQLEVARRDSTWQATVILDV
jgi:SHS2 domain-containing protein